MDKKYIIIFITISLMISNVSAVACTPGTATDGTCCGAATDIAAAIGKGAQTCADTITATRSTTFAPTNCLAGYQLVGGVCTPCDAGTYVGSTGVGHVLTECAACPADQYCPAVVYAATETLPSSCPGTGVSISTTLTLTGKDDITDCVCSTATYVLDTSTSTCVTTYSSGSNCLTFDATSTASKALCTLCKTGYRITPTGCVVCTTPGCTTCDSTGTLPAAGSEQCLTAAVGYYLTTTGSVITMCPPNCTTCIADAATVKCTGTKANYYVSTANTAIATACTAGTSSLETPALTVQAPSATNLLGCPIACSAGCWYCAVNGQDKCDTCNPDYMLAAMLCTAFTDATRDPSCLTAAGPLATDCLTCRTGEGRVTAFVPVNAAAIPAETKGACPCKSGYTDAQKYGDATAALADRSVCQKCGANVMKCKPADLTITGNSDCNTGAKQVDAMSCGLPADKPAGFVYDAVNSAFVACDGSCATCVKAGLGACLTCKDPAAVTPPSDDVTTLIKAWSNGTLPATGGNCYLTCPTPGYVVDEARTMCVAESNGLILSIISIISIVLLI